MKKLIFNDNLLSVYNSSEGQTEILTVISSDSFSDDGMFSVYSTYYIPTPDRSSSQSDITTVY